MDNLEIQTSIFDAEVRRKTKNGVVYVSIIDVIEVLTESTSPKRYWSDLKAKINSEGGQLSDKIVQFKLMASDGKNRLTDCADTETMMRIIQSIPSPKAEPFKVWLAKTAAERIEEIKNPELIFERGRQAYLKQGRDEKWIDQRIKGLMARSGLTDEWQKRGIKGSEYGILSSELSKNALGITPSEHRKIKGLRSQPLRDHMTTIELAVQTLGELAATEITQVKDAKGFVENLQCAKEGGEVAGDARRSLEQKLQTTVVTGRNFLKGKSPI